MDDSNNQNTVNREPETTENLAPVAPPPEDTEVFIDNPASQQSNYGQAPMNVEPSKKGKSKKRIILLVLLLLVVGGAVAYSLTGKDKTTEDPAPQASTDQTNSTDALFYQTNTEFKGYDTTKNSAVDMMTIPDGADVLAINEGAVEVIYAIYGDGAETEPGDQDSVNMKVYRQVEGQSEAELVLQTKTFTYQPVASPVLSADKTQVAYYAFPQTNSTDYQSTANIYTAKIDGKNDETELVKGTTEEHGPLIPVVWAADGSGIYMNNASCYECDGPRTANIWKASTADKTIKKVFTQPNNTTAGGAVASPDGTKIAVSAEDYSLESDFEIIKSKGFDVYVIDLSNDSSKKIYSELPAEATVAESMQNVAGWSQDSSAFLVSVFKMTEEASGDLDYTQVFDRFDAVAIADGRVSPIPVKVSTLNNASEFTATTYYEQLFFSANDPTTSASDTTVSFSFYSLSLGDGVSEVKTIETGLPKLKILGSGKIVSQEEN